VRRRSTRVGGRSSQASPTSHGTAVLALLVAGIATTNQLTGGLYWFVPASLWTIMVGISDAWVLLIEILR
jgi:hypothetical protein